MMFFLKDIKRFLFFSSHQPMQRYAGIPAQSCPRKIAAFEFLCPLSRTNNLHCDQPSASISFLALNYEKATDPNRSRGAGWV